MSSCISSQPASRLFPVREPVRYPDAVAYDRPIRVYYPAANPNYGALPSQGPYRAESYVSNGSLGREVTDRHPMESLQFLPETEMVKAWEKEVEAYKVGGLSEACSWGWEFRGVACAQTLATMPCVVIHICMDAGSAVIFDLPNIRNEESRNSAGLRCKMVGLQTAMLAKMLFCLPFNLTCPEAASYAGQFELSGRIDQRIFEVHNQMRR